jgi:dolichol-phosphate mannosyltransferase
MMRNEVLIFIPTYNERENVSLLYDHIKKLPDTLDILFLDDNSPDGTGKIIDELAAHDKSVHVIHRPAKLGLGTAHIKGFEFARNHGYKFLITMDADFTHHPSYIPQLLEHRFHANIVIGSRYIQGGSMHGWGRIRLPFTYFWRNMIKRGLGMPYDCTTAFRLYNVECLKPHIYNSIQSKGFSFCMESLYAFHTTGISICEIPIQAHNRKYGKSKLSINIMREVLFTYLKLVFKSSKKE